jgi:hypothetical protein
MDLLESVSENLNVNFMLKEFPDRQTIHNLVNKLRSMEVLDKKQTHKHQVVT